MTDAPGGGARAGDASVAHEVVASFDGTPIAITVFRPAGASAERPAPLVLRGHGWSLSRDRAPTGLVGLLIGEGIGVITFDARGHGESGGLARVNDPDFEIKDVAAVLDWAFDRLPWAMREPGAPDDHKDLVLGASGGSYGGGWQIPAAAIDGRLDALAPEITWNSLPRSLAPNGAVKSSWVHALYAGAKLNARPHPDLDRWYAQVMATNRIPDDARAHFENASAYPYVGRARAPALLVQGVPDTLFNLNEALDSFRALRANGTDAFLFTHLGGHLVSATFFAGFLDAPVRPSVPDAGVPQPGDGGSPCGDVDATIAAWFAERLLGHGRTGLPPVSLALDDGTCLALEHVPEPVAFRPGGPLVLPPGAGSAIASVLVANATTVIAGVPRLTASATIAGTDEIAFASLVAVDRDGRERVLSSQVTGFRLAGPGAGKLDVELGGVGAVVAEGSTLLLRIERENEFYATNSGRVPGALVLQDVSLALPVAGNAEGRAHARRET